MRKMVITLLALGVFASSTAFAANQVRISQIFGANSATNAFNQDYVELYNSGTADLNIGGWAVEYSSSGATALWGGTGSSWQTYCLIPAGSVIKACGYFLVGGANTAGGTSLPVAVDVQNVTMNLSGTTGRVGLFSSFYAGGAAGTACNTEGAVLQDKVAYGTAACPEGAAAAPAPSITTAIFRLQGGAQDTDQNLADFATGAGAPRNSASAINVLCTPVPTTATTWGKVKTIYR
jgi:hypothetical protein